MDNLDSRSSKKNDLSLALSGVLGAFACFWLLGGWQPPEAQRNFRDPVAMTAISEAKKHSRKGQWTQAVKLLKIHATAANPEVLLEYGKLLARGWGLPKDLDKARQYLLMAVQHEFPKRGQTAFELGRVYQKSTGPECSRIAFEWFSKAVNWGFGKAHAELGRHRSRGIGVEKNLEIALQHFQLAALHGSANSLFSFVSILHRSPKLQENLPPMNQLINNAVAQLEAEAFAGKASSARSLGRIYNDGKLLQRDTTIARLWFKRGVEMNDAGSMIELAKLTFRDQTIALRKSIALDLLDRAGALNHAGAFTEAGRIHLKKVGGRNLNLAVAFFKKGAANGHPSAMFELGKLHLDGELGTRSLATARELFQSSAKRGHAGAKSKLAVLDGRKSKMPSKKVGLQSRDFAKIVLRTGAGNSKALLTTDSIRPLILKVPTSFEPKLNRSKEPATGATAITRFGKRG